MKQLISSSTVNIIFNGEKQNFPPKVRKTTGMSTLSTVIHHTVGSPSLRIQTTKRNTRCPSWQGGVKLSLLTDMILSVENPKDSTKKLLGLIQQFRKVSECKINIQKSVAFLYINNETVERKIKEFIPFIISPKTIKYLGINLTKEVKDQHSEIGRAHV